MLRPKDDHTVYRTSGKIVRILNRSILPYAKVPLKFELRMSSVERVTRCECRTCGCRRLSAGKHFCDANRFNPLQDNRMAKLSTRFFIYKRSPLFIRDNFVNLNFPKRTFMLILSAWRQYWDSQFERWSSEKLAEKILWSNSHDDVIVIVHSENFGLDAD